MFYHGNGRIFYDKANKVFTTAGDNTIYCFITFNKIFNALRSVVEIN